MHMIITLYKTMLDPSILSTGRLSDLSERIVLVLMKQERWNNMVVRVSITSWELFSALRSFLLHTGWYKFYVLHSITIDERVKTMLSKAPLSYTSVPISSDSSDLVLFRSTTLLKFASSFLYKHWTTPYYTIHFTMYASNIIIMKIVLFNYPTVSRGILYDKSFEIPTNEITNFRFNLLTNPLCIFSRKTLNITSRNNAPISNFGGGFQYKSEYPWCIIEVKS
ncbi:glutamate receptor ionotropic, NMDA 3A-like [Aphis craccivora]|uniref:Glutamate receptor ionotropic, NMDA 3A-like n=1 Tax=Aphis craccivora TaxID=307492 RepID=A0A6G0Z5E2_APHCR|nr:glutamate receptor ionotropic, NMDA 3A-like [Aphis craccivora]